MPTMVTSIENQRPNWPSVSSPITLTGLPAYVNTLENTNPDSQLTGMTRTGEWRFSGADQDGDERRPQGIAVKDGIILTQWKFISGTNIDKQKLILVDPAQAKWRNIQLLEVGGGGLFNSFTAAVGGIGVSGNYLYLQSNFVPRSFRVYDLREFYELAVNDAAVDPADDFADTYPYFLPQIGEIFVTIPEGSGMGWFSIHNGEFIFGNFYDPDNGFTLGGRSFVWRCPVITQEGVEFPVPGDYEQIEPDFPAGADIGTTVTRVQGGIVSGDALILSRSWSTTTQNLMVLNRSDPAKFFVGTAADPQVHHDTNWLRGCEGVTAGLDPDSMVTVQEFQFRRNVTQWDLADVRALAEAAAHWYASPSGSSTNNGTRDSPWDLESALLNTTDIQPGDTLFLMEGTYVHPDRSAATAGSCYRITLQGASGSPITVRPDNGGRVTIDGGIYTNSTAPLAQYVIVRDLEIIVGENLTQSRVADSEGSTETYTSLNRPWGGVDLIAGTGLKVVNCVIHGNAQGIGFWQGTVGDSELYGNIVYDNGWLSPSGAPHGHGIYTQNDNTTRKYIRNNILAVNYWFNLHGYGESGAVDNYTVEDNISYGGPRGIPGTIRNFLLGSNDPNSNRGHVVSRNRLWHSVFRMGYDEPIHDSTLEDNMVVLADDFFVAGSTNVTNTGHFVWGEDLHGTVCQLEPSPRNGAPTPSGPDVFIEINAYDSARAHIAIFNYFLDSEVSVDFSSFLTNGQDFHLRDPTDFYGLPVYENTYQGSPLMIPTGGKMFVPLVAIQAESQQPVAVPSSGFMW